MGGSQCLKAGHNKATVKEIVEIQKVGAEAKKAQSEAVRTHAAQKVSKPKFTNISFVSNVCFHNCSESFIIHCKG